MIRLINCFLFVVAIVATVAATEGLAQTMQADTVLEYLFCALIAFGTGLFAFVFWAAAFHIAPHLRARRLLVIAWIVIVIGAQTLLLMSAWWSAAAIGGEQALQSHHAAFVPKAERLQTEALSAAGEYVSILPRIETMAADFAAQAKCELDFGCITGSAGPGGIASLLSQMANAAGLIATTGRQAENSLSEAKEVAAACLESMRSAATKTESGEAGFAEAIDCFNAALTDIRALQAGRQLNMSLLGFASGLVVPASVTSERQIEAANRIIDSAKVRAEQLAADAAVVSQAESAPTEPLALTRLNHMQAVFQYWHTIVPAVATSVALDLSPLVLLILRSIMAAAMRDDPDQAIMAMPLGDLVAAILGSRRLKKSLLAPEGRLEPALAPEWGGSDDGTVH